MYRNILQCHGYNLQLNPEIVRRWSSEVQEAASSEDPMVQFHAITLLHQIKQTDRLAVSKLVLHSIRSNIRSPLAICTLIRYSSEVPCITASVEYITNTSV